MKRSVLCVTLVTTLLLAGAPVLGTDVCGRICTDTTWGLAGSPYVVTCPDETCCGIEICCGATLNIDPGVEVRFEPGLDLEIKVGSPDCGAGTLVAIGTEASKILFTSNAPEPAPGDWLRIYFTEQAVDAAFDVNETYVSGSILEHAIVEYAGADTGDGAVKMLSSSPYLNYTEIRHSAHRCVRIDGATGRPQRIEDCNIWDCHTSDSGGGIYLAGGFGHALSDNYIHSCSADLNGGGIYLDAQTTLQRNTVEENTAQHGGGVYLAAASDRSLLDSNTIVDNIASTGGGGIYFSSSGGCALTSNTITDNTASGGSGGGVCFHESGGPELRSNTIMRNAAEGSGAGVCFDRSGVAELTSNTINRNATNSSGGGVHFNWQSDNNRLIQNDISENSALLSGGGACFYESDGNELRSNTMTYNSASSVGGGIYFGGFFGSSGTLISNIIAFNDSFSDGGGAYLGSGSGGTLTSNTITDNTALMEGGGLFFTAKWTLADNSVVYNHTLAGETGGILTRSNLTFAECNWIHDNDGCDFTNASSSEITAECQYWGSCDVNQIEPEICDCSDDPGLECVDYEPFAQPDCTCCGNGICEPGEDNTNCPADCYCGNGTCDSDENTDTCSQDCYCDNGTCDSGEDNATCPQDCYCSNGTCDDDENSCTCPEDCAPLCGDGCCTGDETKCNCPEDCIPDVCGDGCCTGTETKCDCPEDCIPDVCGDGCCTGDETKCDCPEDCILDVCGDGCCTGSETKCDCPQDCIPDVCGDGCCTGDETCMTCEVDCGACCGNGELDDGEECDDGNTDDCDGCDPECVVEECGNDNTQCNEECDGTDDAACPGRCQANCTCGPPPRCGDGNLDPGEACDDGNNADCDGCRGDCSAVEGTCGDNVFDPVCEACDDGNNADCDGCDPKCVVEECGNDKTQCNEECDGTDDVACPGECQANCTCGIDFEYSCVIVAEPSMVDQTTTLPDGLRGAGLKQTFYAEFWATDSGGINTGITCAYVDIDYPEGSVSCVPPPVITPLFPLFPSGTCDGSLVDELGGCQLSSGVGMDPEWARIAYVEFTCDAMGLLEFGTGPAAGESSAYNRGLIPTSDIDYGTCSVECIGCPCIYDLDNNCNVAGGDLGLFAGCWLCCDTEPCWEENTCEDKDFDCNGCVAGGDLGWFAGAWLKTCDQLDPVADYPPSRQCDGPIVCPWPDGVEKPGCNGHGGTTAVASARRPGKSEGVVKLALHLTKHQTRHFELDQLSHTWPGNVELGECLYAEVWAKDSNPGSEGLTAVFTDVFYDLSEFKVLSIDPGRTFTLFSEPTVESDEGVIRGVGGATMVAKHGAGAWTRVSVIELKALVDVARPEITLQPSEGEAVSRRGQGLVSVGQIHVIPRLLEKPRFRRGKLRD